MSLIHIPNTFAEINSNITHPVANTKFIAGHAIATINSHLTGSL